MERSQLAALYGVARQQYLEKMRRAIIQDQRVDILAREVLGFDVTPFHLHIMKTQVRHHNNLVLAPRGFGKSTIGTVVKVIWYLCAFPKVRIAISSKTVTQANARLAEIKKILESGGEDRLLFELFGEFRNPDKWNANTIEIRQRFDPKFKDSPGAKPTDATPSVICVGADQSKAGFHVDVDFDDDLIDEKNSRTPVVREGFEHWYNNTYLPMLDPPHPDVPFRGHHHRVGTRYHQEDYYGKLIDQSRKDWKAGVPDKDRIWIEVIPAIDYRDTSVGDGAEMVGNGLGEFEGTGSGLSPWPERHSVENLKRREREIGTLAFKAQYLNDITSHDGEIFSYKDFVEIEEDQVRSLFGNMKFYIGVDLAIGEKSTADFFFLVVVGVKGRGQNAKYYIVDEYFGKGVRFSDQTSAIRKYHDKWNSEGGGVRRIGIEKGGYQNAQFQNLEDRAIDASTPEARASYALIKKKIKKLGTNDRGGKVERAHVRSPLVESGRVHLMVTKKKVGGLDEPYVVGWRVRDHMVLMPNGRHDDGFDAFDFAVEASLAKRRNKRNGAGMGLV
jgi:phage terminase large subunit-like protein